MDDRTRLWLIISCIFIPSSILYVTLMVMTRSERRSLNRTYGSIFYRLFFVQGVLEISMLCVYIAGKMLIRERLLGNATIMSSNGSIFPMFYYYGMVQYFFNVQVWGVIVQSIGRFALVCIPDSRARHVLESLPDAVWALINILVPMAPLCRQVLQDPVSFVPDTSGNALLFVPPRVSQANATQCIITTSVATVFCALCNFGVLRKILQFRSDICCRLSYLLEIRLAIVGFVHFLAQCAMTAFHIIVIVAVNDPPFIQSIRTNYIIPIMVLTFVHPWMLLITHGNLRRRICNWIAI